MPLDGSPYYVRTTNTLPEALPVSRAPWLASLRAWFHGFAPNFTAQQAKIYTDERTTGQIPASSDTYATKLQANWSAGLRSNDMQASTITPKGWFPWPVGGPTGRQEHGGPQPEAPSGTPIGDNVNQAPLPSPNRQFGSVHLPDVNDATGSLKNFNHGAAPWRVPLARKMGISLMAGVAQFSTQQFAAGMVSSVVIAPPVWSNRTRGARSVSGIFGRVQSPGRTRVPSVYVPNQVR